MARKINLQAVSSLFAVQFSERSGLVKDVKAAESILRGMKPLQKPDSPALKRTRGLEIQVRGFSLTKIGTLSATKNVFRFALF